MNYRPVIIFTHMDEHNRFLSAVKRYMDPFRSANDRTLRSHQMPVYTQLLQTVQFENSCVRLKINKYSSEVGDNQRAQPHRGYARHTD